MITVNIEKCSRTNAYVCYMKYNTITVMFPVDSETDIELNNRQVSQIFNLCTDALRDYKNAILKEHEDNKGRIKFVGVDYDKI